MVIGNRLESELRIRVLSVLASAAANPEANMQRTDTNRCAGVLRDSPREPSKSMQNVSTCDVIYRPTASQARPSFSDWLWGAPRHQKSPSCAISLESSGEAIRRILLRRSYRFSLAKLCRTLPQRVSQASLLKHRKDQPCSEEAWLTASEAENLSV